ncbi:hypothetical protein ACIBPB_07030 [Micromonospora sp. NPDC049836]|uniref:hypothetical protein n=1 Tax=Micromonospora sp. NPDC049836 TaxID=3364274 RepID=UPI00379E6216
MSADSTGADQVSGEKAQILALVRKCHHEGVRHGFVPGVTPILSSGATFDEDDRAALVEAALEMRVAAGVSARRFEREFAALFGLRKAHLTESWWRPLAVGTRTGAAQ